MNEPNPNYPVAPSQGWSEGTSPVPSASVQATMSQMTQQLQTVIDAAERAAAAIRFDAEEQARQHLADAQRKADRLTAERVGVISELTDDLIGHASTVRQHSEQMIRALEDAITSVTDKLEQPSLTVPFAAHGTETEAGGYDPIDEAQPTLADTAPEPEAFAPAVPAAYAPVEAEDAPFVGSADVAPEPVPEPWTEDAEPEVPAPETEAEAEAEDPYLPAAESPPEPVWDPVAEPFDPAPSQFSTPETIDEGPFTSEPPPAAFTELEEPATDFEAPAAPSEDALLHATRLAVAGNDRETIATALREQFGIDDPDPIVNRVLGDS